MKPATKKDFEDLWRSVLPDFYTVPIETEADGRGFDIPSAQASVFERLERSINVSTQAYYVRPHSTQTEAYARGAAKARGDVQIVRAAPVAGALLVPAGTFFEAEQLGTFGEVVSVGRFALVSDLAVPDGSGAPLWATVEAEFAGYSGNLEFPGQLVRFAPQGRALVRAVVQSTTQLVRSASLADQANWDVFTADHRGRYVRIVQLSAALLSSPVPRRVVSTYTDPDGFTALYVDPPLSAADVGKVVQVEVEEWEDLGLGVLQPNPIGGGRSDSLGAIATDRGLGRVAGETDDQLADRVVYLAETISPEAIETIVDSIFGPLGIEWCLREAGDVGSLIGFVWDLHPFDVAGLNRVEKLPDSDLVGQGLVWLGPGTFRRYFLICVQRSGVGDFGFGFDYSSSAHTNAWDVGAFDGSPVGFLSAVGQVWAAVNAARAAGVAFEIVIGCC